MGTRSSSPRPTLPSRQWYVYSLFLRSWQKNDMSSLIFFNWSGISNNGTLRVLMADSTSLSYGSGDCSCVWAVSGSNGAATKCWDGSWLFSSSCGLTYVDSGIWAEEDGALWGIFFLAGALLNGVWTRANLVSHAVVSRLSSCLHSYWRGLEPSWTVTCSFPFLPIISVEVLKEEMFEFQGWNNTEIPSAGVILSWVQDHRKDSYAVCWAGALENA